MKIWVLKKCLSYNKNFKYGKLLFTKLVEHYQLLNVFDIKFKWIESMMYS